MSGTEATKPPTPEIKAPGGQATAARKSQAELLSTDEYSQFMLNTRGEMFAVFRGMVEHVSQVTMFFNENKDMILTSLVSYSDNGLIMDLGASRELNRKALEAKKLFCVTQLEKVKVQFILRGVRETNTSDGPAFLATLPDSVLRLQRREYYRLTTPIAHPLKCVLTFPPAANAETRVVDAHLGDISGGGIGVISIPLSIPLEQGLELGCRIELPEVGIITGTIVVRSVFELLTRSGAKSMRAGCAFVRLPGPMATLIQRYIIKVERERKARESGTN